MPSSTTETSDKAAKRKASLLAKKQAEAVASAQLGKDVKIVAKKPKSKIAKNKGGSASKKWMLSYNIKVNKKTGEATLVAKKKKKDGEKKEKKSKTSSTSSDK
jgi:hypothetical protein